VKVGLYLSWTPYEGKWLNSRSKMNFCVQSWNVLSVFRVSFR